MLTAFYSDFVEIPLPPRHHFPRAKYGLLREQLQPLADAGQLRLEPAREVDREDLLRVHKADYVDRVMTGGLTARHQRELGIPWSADFAQRTLLSCGATAQAAEEAMRADAAIHTAGGTHHAFADRPAGFCVFNDVVVAARRLQSLGLIDRAMVIDCDVHHGDGTADLTRNDPSIFTVSLHGDRNYPRVKPPSDLDVPLPDACDDNHYLHALDDALDQAWSSLGDCVFYIAGADPFVGDKYGRLALTKEGLAERDRRVLARCRDSKVPVVVTLGGGYARDMADTVDIHRRTVEVMLEMGCGR